MKAKWLRWEGEGGLVAVRGWWLEGEQWVGGEG